MRKQEKAQNDGEAVRHEVRDMVESMNQMRR